MTKVNVKKTLNLHKYSIRVSKLLYDWKYVLPLVTSVAGILSGSALAKGEGALSQYTSNFISSFLSNNSYEMFAGIIIYLLIPTIFATIIFFCGLSVYGCFASIFIPFCYSGIISIVTYYLYSNYTLKGLAYCVILIFPYAVLSLFSLILISGESITMSGVLLNKLNKKSRDTEYTFSYYCRNCFKSYIFIILSTVVKSILDRLFIHLFVF